MAQKTVITLIDDLTGKEAEGITKHTLLVDGAGVEIDLTPDNYDKLLEVLRPYLNASGARRIRGTATSAPSRGRRQSPATAGTQDTAAIRAWAKENGYEVNDRGRVPASIREAYEKANG